MLQTVAVMGPARINAPLTQALTAPMLGALHRRGTSVPVQIVACFPIHQSPLPLTRPATSDRNAYDRYWFGMTHRTGEFQIEGAFGRYPNLAVQDASISIARDGRQHSFHASDGHPSIRPTRPWGRCESRSSSRCVSCGSWSSPTRPASPATCVALSHRGAARGPHDHAGRRPRDHRHGALRAVRLVGGHARGRREHDHAAPRGGRRHPRPVVGCAAGRRASAGQAVQRAANAWLWAPLHWRDSCSVVGWFQRPGGEYIRPDGHRIAVVDPVPESVDLTDAAVARVEPVAQRLTFQPGTRWVTAVEIDVEDDRGERHVLALAPLFGSTCGASATRAPSGATASGTASSRSAGRTGHAPRSPPPTRPTSTCTTSSRHARRRHVRHRRRHLRADHLRPTHPVRFPRPARRRVGLTRRARRSPGPPSRSPTLPMRGSPTSSACVTPTSVAGSTKRGTSSPRDHRRAPVAGLALPGAGRAGDARATPACGRC